MDNILATVALEFPTAGVALFAIWRISSVMMVLANGLVDVVNDKVKKVEPVKPS